MRSTLLLAAAALLVFPALAGDPPIDAPLIVDGPIMVDAGDFQGAMRTCAAGDARRVPHFLRAHRGHGRQHFRRRAPSPRRPARQASTRIPSSSAASCRRRKRFLADLYMQKPRPEPPSKMNLDAARPRALRCRARAYMKPEPRVRPAHPDRPQGAHARHGARAARKRGLRPRPRPATRTSSRSPRATPTTRTRSAMAATSAATRPSRSSQPVSGSDRQGRAARARSPGPSNPTYGFHIVRFVDRQKPRADKVRGA